MSGLSELVTSILEDSVIDEGEVGQLRALLLADGIIDRTEADALFQLNDATSGNDNDASWKAFFVESLCAHVLEDDKSPGEVDEDEAAYLKAKIHSDGKVDDNEKALLTALKEKATGTIPGPLSFLFEMYL